MQKLCVPAQKEIQRKLERIQRIDTKLVPELKELPCKEILKEKSDNVEREKGGDLIPIHAHKWDGEAE